MTTSIKARSQRKRGWFFLIPVLLIAGLVIWYFFFRTTEVPLATEPTTQSLFPQSYRETVSGTGTLSPVRSVAATFEFDNPGTLASVVSVGTRVLAGDILASVDTASYERSMRDAEVTLAKAQAQRASTSSSQSDGTISLEQSIQNAELSLQDAERQVTTAQSSLELAQKLQSVGSESSENVKAAQDTFDTALASLEKARLNVQTLLSSKELRSDSNQQDLRNADLSVTSAQLSLERAQDDLAATQLLAPFAGVVSEVNVDAGSIVSSSTPVLTLVDDSQVNLIAQVDETEISSVQLGMLADVTLDAVPDTIFEGKVTTIAPVARVENNIPIFDVTLTIDNPEGTLRPGMSAEAEILVREVASTVTLPTRAIQTVRERSYVQLQQTDGTYALQPVTIVSTSGLNTIVSTELPPGSNVLIPEAESTTGSNPSTNTQRSGLPFLGGPPPGAP